MSNKTESMAAEADGSVQQLREYLDQRGIEYDGRWGADKLQAMADQHEEDRERKRKSEEAKKASEQEKSEGKPEKKETKYNTPDEVKKAIAKQLAVDGFEATFTDTTWYFKFAGAEEAGNLSVPLRVIAQKALMVSRGRRALRGVKGDGTYKGYADQIISA